MFSDHLHMQSRIGLRSQGRAAVGAAASPGGETREPSAEVGGPLSPCKGTGQGVSTCCMSVCFYVCVCVRARLCVCTLEQRSK